MRRDIEQLLRPRGIALVGSVDRRRTPEAVLAEARRRWNERFVLVDTAGGMLGDVPVYVTLADAPGELDVAVVSLAAAEIPGAIEACAERGIRYVVVSAPALGGEADDRVVARARELGLRLLGPNANANCYDELSAGVDPGVPRIGLVTQSGHLGRVVFQSAGHGVAFSRWIPTGNEADLDAADFIEYFAHDNATAVVAGYFEGFRDGVKLRRALAATVATGTPVVAIKVGRHEAATRMAESHTAHLTGSDDVVDGLFAQYGVVRVDDLDELIETAALHAKLSPIPAGMRVGLYGISGGALALMADHAEAEGVGVPALEQETQRRLHEILPEHLGVENPVDNGNLYRTGTVDERRRIFTLVAGDPNVDVLVCALTGFLPGITDDYVSDILDFRARSEKPIVVTWNTWEMDVPAYRALVDSGIPIFRSFRGCFRALARWETRRRRLEVPRPDADLPPTGEPPAATHVAANGEAVELLRRYGIQFVEERTVATTADARAAFAALGPRLVAKLLLPDVSHKSDEGFVRTGIATAEEVVAALDDLRGLAARRTPSGSSPEIVVQPHLEGVEAIVGVVRDPLLGRSLLVGLGGVHAEVLRDVSVRPLPVTPADVVEMVRGLRSLPLFEGGRGAPRADLEGLVRVALGAAELGMREPRLVELDLNPVVVGHESAVAVDQLLVLEA